jgi:hypothetical protein
MSSVEDRRYQTCCDFYALVQDGDNPAGLRRSTVWSCARTVFHQSPLEPHCRVCRNDQLRKKVYGMLATGISCAMILRPLQEDNDQHNIPDRVAIVDPQPHHPALPYRTSRRLPTGGHL